MKSISGRLRGGESKAGKSVGLDKKQNGETRFFRISGSRGVGIYSAWRWCGSEDNSVLSGSGAVVVPSRKEITLTFQRYVFSVTIHKANRQFQR